jgi:AICAR transformylase/IMP cyclohydrolase PurH
MKNNLILSFILSMLVINIVFFSCTKNTDCKATIKCVDAAGTAVPNAAVQLFATVKTGTGSTTGGTVIADLKANGVSDGSGNVSFVFKLPAIYDIVATTTAANTSTNGPATVTITGNSIIKLEEGKNVDKTVTLK